MAATVTPRRDLGAGDEPVDTALDLVDVLGRRIDDAAAAIGLTGPQAMLLRYLAEPQRMGDLAQIRMCDPSSITNLVARLESAGLIERTADPADQRARLVTLTGAGRRARDRFVECLSGGTDGLGRLSDSDVEALRRARRCLG